MSLFRGKNSVDDPHHSNCTLEYEVQHCVSTTSDDMSPKPEKTFATSTQRSSSRRIGTEHGQYNSLEPCPVSSEAEFLGDLRGNATCSTIQYLVRNWLVELGMAIACLLATTPFFFVLGIYDTQPLSAWRFKIQLNSVVSIFATITKGTLLFVVGQSISQLKWLQFRQSREALINIQTYDGASRGPWGAIKLVLSLRCRHLASLGALVIVLSLVIDPLAQELVSYPTYQVVTGRPPARRTHKYTSQTSGMDPLKGLEYPMRGAVYNGLFASEPVAELAPFCSTGNCTWQPFSTLAFCSVCSNVTLSTTKFCKEHPMTGPGAKCNYNLPSGMTIAFSTYSAGSDLMDAGILTDTSNATVAGKRSPTFAFGLVNKTGYGLSVSECALSFCVQTFETTVASGISHSKPVSSWWPNAETSVATVESTHDIIFEPPPSVVNGPGDRTFVVEFAQAISLQAFFNSDQSGVDPSGNSLFNGSITDLVAGRIAGRDTLLAIYSSPNISTLFSNIATSMTNVLRTYGDGTGDDTVPGIAYSMEPFIHVRWQWMAVPAVISLTSFIFLVTAIVVSRHNRIPVWKSSSLALLFHGIDEKEQLGPLGEIREMELIAKELKVALGDENAGYRLV